MRLRTHTWEGRETGSLFMYKREADCRLKFKILKSGFVVVFYRDESSSDVSAPQDTPDMPTVKQTILSIVAF